MTWLSGVGLRAFPRRLGFGAVPWLIVFAINSGPAQAVTRERVLSTPTCPRCTITAVRVGQLGGDGGDADDAKGFFDLQGLKSGEIVGVPASGPEVWILSVTGKLVRRIGRAGEGPGEFRRPWSAMPGPADSLFVFDRILGRVSVFAPNGTFRRSYRVPNGTNAVLPLGGTTAAVVGHLTSSDEHIADKVSVFPVHFVRGDSIQKSLGEVIRSVDPREPFQLDRILVPYRGTVLVINRSYHFTIDQWNFDGALVSRIIREPPWFLPFEHFGAASRTVRPSPLIAAAWVDDREQLWIIGSAAAPTWQQAVAEQPTRGEGTGSIYKILHPELYYQGFVEVIDLKRQTLVATLTLPIEARYSLGNGLVGVVKDNSQVGKYVELYRLKLNGR